ncbi:MAG TPA: hypothetical protein VNM48_11640 [Chloroflexota bacterium]|nr:hypothetical protein [Chloroflexota bacterium]
MVIEAIPTEYKGIAMRSRLESRIAYLLDSLQGLETTHDKRVWQFEPRSFMLPNGQTYRPDFWVPGLGLWVETRGKDYTRGNLQIESFRANLQTLHPEARAYLTIGPTQALMHISGKASDLPVVFPCPAGGWAIGIWINGSPYCLRCQIAHDTKRFRYIIYSDGLIQAFDGSKTYDMAEFIQWMHTPVKPVKPIAVYMAGKIARSDWRPAIIGSDFPIEAVGEGNAAPEPFDGGRFLYTGPFFTACLHGYAIDREGPVAHCECGHCGGAHEESDPEPLYGDVVGRALSGIRNADAVFVWLNAADAYGTFAEIGVAHAIGKPVYLYESEALRGNLLARPERWFLYTLATSTAFMPSARDAWADFCARQQVTPLPVTPLRERLAAKVAEPEPSTAVIGFDDDDEEPGCHPHCNAQWREGRDR